MGIGEERSQQGTKRRGGKTDKFMEAIQNSKLEPECGNCVHNLPVQEVSVAGRKFIFLKILFTIWQALILNQHCTPFITATNNNNNKKHHISPSSSNNLQGNRWVGLQGKKCKEFLPNNTNPSALLAALLNCQPIPPTPQNAKQQDKTKLLQVFIMQEIYTFN